GNRAASFNAGPSLALNGQAVSLAVGDLDGNGAPDLVVDVGTGVQLYLGDGRGGFTQAASFSPGFGMVAVADFDGDGLQDVAFGYDGDLTILKGDGHGGLSLGAVVPGLLHGASFLTADLDRDGFVDLAWVGTGISPGDLVIL